MLRFHLANCDAPVDSSDQIERTCPYELLEHVASEVAFLDGGAGEAARTESHLERARPRARDGAQPLGALRRDAVARLCAFAHGRKPEHGLRGVVEAGALAEGFELAALEEDEVLATRLGTRRHNRLKVVTVRAHVNRLAYEVASRLELGYGVAASDEDVLVAASFAKVHQQRTHAPIAHDDRRAVLGLFLHIAPE